jgi:hypothetical protein
VDGLGVHEGAVEVEEQGADLRRGQTRALARARAVVRSHQVLDVLGEVVGLGPDDDLDDRPGADDAVGTGLP